MDKDEKIAALEAQIQELRKQNYAPEDLYCLAKHFIAFHDQCCREVQADLGQPCSDCKYVESCRSHWWDRTHAVFERCGIWAKVAR